MVLTKVIIYYPLYVPGLYPVVFESLKEYLNKSLLTKKRGNGHEF